MPGVTEASTAMASATGSGWRRDCQMGVVTRQMNRAIRNQVRKNGSSRVMGKSSAPPMNRLKSEYAVSKST